MLGARVLNSSASLNSYEDISALKFIPGEQVILVIQFFQLDREDELRYMLPETATVTVSLPKKDGSDQSVSLTVLEESNVEDRSVWTGELSEAITELLAGGNFTAEIDEVGDGSKIVKAFIQNGLSRVITGAC